MTLQIELTEQQSAILRAKAAAEGLTLEAWVQTLVQPEPVNRVQPLETGYGILAKYGPAPSANEIDENRREMLRGHTRDLGSLAFK